MERLRFRDQPYASLRSQTTVTPDWREALPMLAGRSVTLRELRPSDATSLLTMISSDEVARFISAPPATIDGYERFVAWTRREREAGRGLCFGIVPNGMDSAVGLFQIHQTEPAFATAEWGFALGSPYWGRGLFIEGARLVLDFAFDVVGVHRLEARAAVHNGRGNGALRKVGAFQEGILRRSLLRDGEYLDQVLWAIIDSDRRHSRAYAGPSIH
jgi:[ribosomal protein S5]-alanine N-acetyltransferase